MTLLVGAPVSEMDGLVSVCLSGVQLVWPVKGGMTTISEDGVMWCFIITPPIIHHNCWRAAETKCLATESWNCGIHWPESSIDSFDQTK